MTLVDGNVEKVIGRMIYAALHFVLAYSEGYFTLAKAYHHGANEKQMKLVDDSSSWILLAILQ